MLTAVVILVAPILDPTAGSLRFRVGRRQIAVAAVAVHALVLHALVLRHFEAAAALVDFLPQELAHEIAVHKGVEEPRNAPKENMYGTERWVPGLARRECDLVDAVDAAEGEGMVVACVSGEVGSFMTSASCARSREPAHE